MTLKKKILFYSDVYEPTTGGLVTSLKRILNGLSASNRFEIHLLSYNPELSKSKRSIVQNNLHIHGHGSGEIDLAYLYVQSAQRKIVELERIHGYSLFVAFFAHLPLLVLSNISNVFSKPYVVCARGSDVYVNLKNPSYREYLRPYFVDSSALISVSSAIADLIRDWNLVPKTGLIDVVPNSVDSSLYLESVDKKCVDETTYDFLFIGNARPEKRFDLVIEALNLLKNKGVRSKVCSVLIPHRRHPGLIEKYKHIVENYGLNDTIEFVPPTNFSGIKKLYRKSKYFILASDHEGLSNTLLESMASGCFVLARHSLLPDSLNDSECICFSDQHSLADAMLTGLRNKNKVSRVNNEIILSKFGCDREIASYERVFSNIID